MYKNEYVNVYIMVVDVERETLGGSLCGRWHELGRYR